MLFAKPREILLMVNHSLFRVEHLLATAAAMIPIISCRAGSEARARARAGAGAGKADDRGGSVVADSVTVRLVSVGERGTAFIMDIQKGSSCPG